MLTYDYFSLKGVRAMQKLSDYLDPLFTELQEEKLSTSLEQNKQRLEDLFRNCSDVVFRSLQLGTRLNGLIVYVEGIVNSEDLSDYAIRPLLLSKASGQDIDPESIEKSTLTISKFSEAAHLASFLNAILAGNAGLLIDGQSKATILNVKGGTRRGVQEPQTESVVRGPREGFTENLRVNTSLVRFKIKTPRLKTISYTIGQHTQTNVVLAYMEGLADPEILREVEKRLQDIRIDGVLESGYIEELIEDSPYSPFPQLQYSERPDTIAAQLLEGRFAIFVDGTPFVLSGPVVFAQFLQASEDYYERYMVSNLIRWLRCMFLFLALFLPALYIATTTFHQDMLPTNLLLSIAAARESIPFPALVEALIMEISFEALREAGIRLPKTVGQAVSILGALVIGQAAVEAGIVSAPMVIIVSVTGIASFTIPRFNMSISIRILRFPLMIMGGLFGLFGIIIGTVWLAIHLCHLRSFGVPYLSGFAPYRKDDMKDIFIRVPWWKMVLRPRSISHANRQRMKKGRQPAPHNTKR
jgi:spore germination protein